MHQFAGPLVLVLAGLWLVYLVPHKLRYRQQLLESRVDDRYSEALRVVRVTTRAAVESRGGRVVRTVEGRAHAGTTGLLTPGKGYPVIVGSRTGGDTVDRPHATPERTSAAAARKAAQIRAARAAAQARRAAAARRRAALAAFLLIAAVAGWAAYALVPLASVFLGVVPTLLFGSVLVAGRAAVVSGKRHDEAMAQQIAQSDEVAAHTGATRAVSAPTRVVSAPTPTVTGRAVKPSDAQTEMFAAIVADQGEKGATPRHATGQIPLVKAAAGDPSDAQGWEPKPMPKPTYTMKPAAPRREPAPLGEVEASTSVRPAAAPPVAVSDEEVRTPEVPVEGSGSIDLNAVLAKRRASGE